MKNFEEYRLEIHKKRLSSAVLFMAIPLYMSFSFLDYLFTKEYWLLFLEIRVVSCILFLVIIYFFLPQLKNKPENVTIFGHIGTAILGFGIGFMSYLTGGLSSPYYAGLNWIAIGSLAFWPSTMLHRIISVLTIYGPLFLLCSFSGNDFTSINSLLPITFMLGTCVLSIMNNSLSMKSLLEEFNLRKLLEKLNTDKDVIIERKSNEAANLKRLAKQFSPAVIEAIETKSISLDQRNRKEVAIIFLDIVDSTKRSNQLDHGDYQKALDLFFDSAIKKLLKNNITVANFMGDGLMAIANAPYTLKNYQLAAIQTSLEIVESTQKMQRQLKEYWGADFKIRIGISSGYANVGFFPNNDFGVYTAIGESVNLASRLCHSADSQTIAVTKKIIIESESISSSFSVKQGGLISDLKGFAGNDLEYYLISTKEISKLKEQESCPLCGSELASPTDLGDCHLIKCTSCKYSDIVNKADTVKKAS